MCVDVLVAVRHPVMRRGVVSLLSEHAGLKVVGQCGTMEELGRKLSAAHADVVLLDRTSVPIGAHATLRNLYEEYPSVRFLPLSPYERSGKEGNELSLVNDEPNILVSAIKHAMQGRGTGQAPWSSLANYAPLTAREHEVLLLAAEGYTSGQIARSLSISPRTVELHRFRMCRKLGVHSPLDLAKYVIRQGLAPS